MDSPDKGDKGRLGQPMKVTCTRMWVDLLGAGADQAEIDKNPNTYLLELWRQLWEDQRFTPEEGHKGNHSSGH